MSSCHFQVYCQDGEWLVEDNRSTNGLFHNGVRVERGYLTDGDFLRAGQTEFEVILRSTPVVQNQPRIPLPQEYPDYNPDPAPQHKEEVLQRVEPSLPKRRVDLNVDVEQSDAPNATNVNSIRESVKNRKQTTSQVSVPADASLKRLTGVEVSYPLFNERRTIIGSGRSCDIVLDGEPGVSDQHVSVQLENGMLLINDLGSTAGTYVNGDRVTHGIASDGWILQVGDCRLLFSAEKVIPASTASVLSGEDKAANQPLLSKDQHVQAAVADELEIEEVKEPIRHRKLTTSLTLQILNLLKKKRFLKFKQPN